MKKPLIMVAPNGARRSKNDHPNLPITIPEIIDTARQCHELGAEAIHLHVRDNKGLHSLDHGIYLETINELEVAVPKMLVQITTESADIFSVEQQFTCLKLVRPKWCSISVREIAKDQEKAKHIYALCHEQNTKIQHILYDNDDLKLMYEWQSRGIIKNPTEQKDLLFVLGRYTSQQESNPDMIESFLNSLDGFQLDHNWMVCAFGKNEHACLKYAHEKNGDIRVGFENSLVGEDGTVHNDNMESIVKLKKLLGASIS